MSPLRTELELRMAAARHHARAAAAELDILRCTYEMATVEEMPDPVKRRARIVALERKVDALLAVGLDPDAYPWSEDGVPE